MNQNAKNESASLEIGGQELLEKGVVLHVYISALPEEPIIGNVCCDMRNREIAQLTNEKVRAEKYYVWRLLEYAMENSLCILPKGVEFTQNAQGKWSSPSFFFSLSHSEGALAVAVSREPVGVDIELIEKPKNERVVQRIMTPDELELYVSLPESQRVAYLISSWTAKEAFFKKSEDQYFEPRAIPASQVTVITKRVTVGDRDYMCSVCSDHISYLRVTENVELN